MLKTKITKGEYEKAEDVNIEVSDSKKEFVVNVFNVKKTLEVLREKRQRFLEQVDAEIDYNENILSNIKEDLDKMKYKKRDNTFVPPSERG